MSDATLHVHAGGAALRPFPTGGVKVLNALCDLLQISM